MSEDTKLDLAEVRDELRARLLKLAGDGHALHYCEGGKVTIAKPVGKHVVITGRNARDGLSEIAVLVTEMEQVKHSSHAGMKAQAGVEL